MYNSIYPIQIKPYVPPQPKPKGALQNKEEEENPSYSSAQNRELSGNNSTDPNGHSRYSYQEFPNGQKTTIDYSKSKVNIAQILTDFKNTALAIGSPPTVINEVNQYLSIAENESLKSDPNKKRIQSNLKNASNILDEFISKTLNKKSKVVENWIEALFLQQVDYKSDPDTINPDFLVKLPDKETGDMKPISQDLSTKAQGATTPTAEQSSQTEVITQQETITQENKSFYVPQNMDIKNALVQGKKLASANDSQNAIKSFEKALELSKMLGDKNAEGIANFELGKIYDRNDNLSEALKHYNQAHTVSSDYNLKARAYYSMAQIYDDVVFFEPAMSHYFAAISYAGEAENFVAQTKALANIGDMYAERYDIPNTYKYYDTAKSIAVETNDNKTKGYVWSRSGDALARLNETINALKDYKSSAQYYENTESPQKTARNYEKAAEIMMQLGNTTKAQKLIAKAQQILTSAS